MATSQQKLVIVLVAVLLAVIIVSGVVLWALPSQESANTLEFSDTETSASLTANSFGEETDNALTETTSAPTEFNIAVFERAVFRALNLTLITNGSLPVGPPGIIGKANPFL